MPTVLKADGECQVGRAVGGWSMGGAVGRIRWCKRKVKNGGLLAQTDRSFNQNLLLNHNLILKGK